MESKSDVHENLFAKQISEDRFLLGNDVLNRAQLEAVLLGQLAVEHATREREVPVLGEDVDAKARELLATRGNYSPTAEDYLAACEQIGAA